MSETAHIESVGINSAKFSYFSRGSDRGTVHDIHRNVNRITMTGPVRLLLEDDKIKIQLTK
ncbi:MAG: hypothetical protein M3270_04390 [Thermoproteota archaeon]|nr:hypothetical protein [Thermoproteota archaeon]